MTGRYIVLKNCKPFHDFAVMGDILEGEALPSDERLARLVSEGYLWPEADAPSLPESGGEDVVDLSIPDGVFDVPKKLKATKSALLSR